jgi:putative sterol carrier protein
MSTTTTTKASTAQRFFDDLALRQAEPFLRQVTGTIEWNIAGAGRWWVTINNGALQVSQSPHASDCIATCDLETFSAIISGEQNEVAAALRGAIKISGNPALALSFQRLLH